MGGGLGPRFLFAGAAHRHGCARRTLAPLLRMTTNLPDLHAALFETAPDALLVVEASGRIVLVNRQAESLFGLNRSELVGQPIERLIPERFRDGHVDLRNGYMGNAGIRRMGAGPALYARRGDGSEIPVEIALGPVEAGGRRLFAAAVRDISDLARTRQDALRGRYNSYIAQFGLRALKDPDFTTLVEAASPLVTEAMLVDAVIAFRLSPDRQQLHCIASHGIPREAAGRLHVPNAPHDLLGHMVAQRAPVVVRDALRESRFEIAEAIRALGLRSALCVPLFGRNEVIGALTACTVSPRDWSSDDMHFMQAIANIMAAALERSTTEEALMHAQRLEALGQLTGGVAHDFNNLLMVITGSLQLLEDLGAERPEQRELLRQAIGAADRGALLTRKLLAFARKQPLHPRPVDLNHLVAEFRDLTQRTLGENVTVRIALEPALPLLLVDAAQLETALLNLAVNARDAMPGGGVLTVTTARVCLQEQRSGQARDLNPGDYAIVSVSDTGTGMPPEVLARAIEPFFTTKAVGKGSGLGLSMVYGFAEQSGGTVELASVPNQGTTVRLYLPLASVAENDPAAAARTEVASGSAIVLVVEDDAPVRAVAAAFLTQLGYRVLQAGDAESAERVLRSEPGVELLFTDIALPGVDGIQLAQTARALRPELPVLFTSGYASDGALSRLPAEFRDSVLPKPYLREELAYRVQMVLAAARP